jgi:nuclear GTP-binding protein
MAEKTSKRLSAKRRYNIEKKVREHNKKLKKELRKKSHSSRPNKDPGIPNSLPFKEQVIKEAQEDRRRDEERKQLVRDLQKDKRRQQRDDQLLKKRGLDELTADALARGEQFEAKGHSDGHSSTSGQSDKTSNLKSYYKEFHKVIEASDVVVEVLDARDPIGSRCPQVEEEVMRNGANKRLILLLNKVDLIPRENLKKWLRYLRNELPTVAFKACTQKQKSNLSRSRVNVLVSSEELLSSSKCLGADILMKLLSNYCRNKDLKTSITVGVVGFPNVGKSSVINSLKRCHACAVGPTPGLTRAMQLVSLDKRIKLVDSPGIIFADNSNKTEANVHSSSLMALRNAVKIETLSDPTAAVDALLNRVDRQHLTLFYRLSAFKDVNEFLALLAKRFGKLKKGGVVDVEGAARKVLNDWNVGKIRYFTVPPETQCLPFHINAQIVSQMSREFDINERIFDEEMNEINKNIPQNLSESEALLMNSFGFTSARLETEDDKQEDMEQSGAPTTWGQTSILLKQSKQQVCEDSEMKELPELKGMQLNREKRVMFKKLKKQRKRKQKIANKLSNSLQSDISLDNESYDFETDF